MIFPRYIYDNYSLEKKQRNTEAWITGMRKEFITIGAHQDSEMLVVRFKVGHGFQVLNTPLDQIGDKVVPAADLLGKEILNVRKNLLAIDNGEEKIAFLENWLLRKKDDSLAIPPTIEGAISRMFANPLLEDDSLQNIIQESQFSKKQFIYLFKKHVGTTPKSFQKILRFQ